MSDDPRCAKCGHPRSNHPYRHPFVGPSKDDIIKTQADRIEELEAKLAKAVEALDEAVYLLAPDEKDITRKAGVYRIVTTLVDLNGTERTGR